MIVKITCPPLHTPGLVHCLGGDAALWSETLMQIMKILKYSEFVGISWKTLDMHEQSMLAPNLRS